MHKEKYMNFLNKLISIIDDIINGEEHKIIRQRILDCYEDFLKYNFENENEYILCAGLFYNFYKCLNLMEKNKRKVVKENKQVQITVVDVYDTEKMYIQNIDYLTKILQEKIPEQFPDLKYEEKNISDAVYKIIQLLEKENQLGKVSFHNFESFCSVYFSDNYIFHKKISDFILYYFYLWTSVTTSSRKNMSDNNEILFQGISKAWSNILLEQNTFKNWIFFNKFWTNNRLFSFAINHVLYNEPFPATSDFSISRAISEILEAFLQTALTLDLYDYPGYYIILVQLIKEMDFNDFYNIFDDSKNLKEVSLDHDIYYKTTLKKLTNKDGLKYENFFFDNSEMKNENSGNWANFVRSIFGDENSNNKILQFLSFFALWQIAADIKEKEVKQNFMKIFFDASLSNEWKDINKLIKIANKISSEYKFIKKNGFTNLFTKKDLSKLEKDIRITEVFLLISPACSCEGIQLSLINKLDKLRDEKLLCKPHSSIHYEISENDERDDIKNKAENEITRCVKNRKTLSEMDKGFSYIYKDFYLAKKWFDTKAYWDKSMTCKLFHEPDKSYNHNVNLNTPKGKKQFFYIKTTENYVIENKNCLSNNYLLLLRHLKTHGDHHVITNLLKESPNTIVFLKTMKIIKENLSDKINDTNNLEERKTIMFYIDCIEYIENEFNTKISEKKNTNDYYISFEQDFSKDFKTFVYNTLNAIYSVQEDFMYKYKNQVNLYLCYMAESLIQF